jgi:hypothetical protein
VERDGRVLDEGSGIGCIPPVVVQIVDIGELAVERAIILIGE